MKQKLRDASKHSKIPQIQFQNIYVLGILANYFLGGHAPRPPNITWHATHADCALYNKSITQPHLTMPDLEPTLK